MTTRQEIDKIMWEKVILELREEIKEYEQKIIELRQKGEDAQDIEKTNDFNEIQLHYERISSRNRRIRNILLIITELTKQQGKITAPPICYILRQIMN